MLEMEHDFELYTIRKMSQINTLPPPPPPSSHTRAHQLQEHYQQEQQYQSQNPIHFLTPSDVYAAYADTFDLSLLPDECDLPLSPACSAYSNSSQSQTLDYIPTTVYQHTTATTNNNNNNSTQIKIERNWSNLTEETTIKNEPISMIDDQQQTQQQDEQNQHQKLERKRSDPISIPQRPTARPQIYPSPQSSPEQTDCSFHARYGSNYSSLSSSRNSLYPPSPSSFSSASFLSPSAASPSYLSTRSPCSSSSYSSSSASSGYSSSRYSSSPYSSSPYASSNCSTSPFPATTTPCITANCSSVDISRVKQEFHTLPPSPPESSCEAPSPHCFADIKSEPLDADVETLIDINSLLSKSLENLHYSSGDSSAATETSTVCQQFESLEVKKEESTTAAATAAVCNQDHQLLREYLEDTTFQRKHNLKPLALESLIGGLGVRGDIEPVISLALEHAKREAEATCAKLQILPDPKTWKTTQVHAWLRSTIEQFKLPQINDLETKFPENGTTLALLSEEEFTRRAPECGSTIHAQLEIWKLAYSNGFQDDNPATTLMAQQYQQQHQQSQQLNNGTDSNDIPGSLWHVTECGQKIEMDMDEGSDVEDDDALPPTSVLNVTAAAVSNASSDTATSTATATSITTAVVKPIGSTPARNGGSHIHLWQFLKELLAAPHINGTAIRWIDRCKGVFKIEDSVRVAKLWGRRKNRPAMNYDKLSRSIRQYYKKGIMKKTERSQRLVYQFCHPYNL